MDKFSKINILSKNKESNSTTKRDLLFDEIQYIEDITSKNKEIKHSGYETIENNNNNENEIIEDMKKGKSNILVTVRVRPLSSKESEFNDAEIIKVLNKNMLVLLDPFEYNGHNDIFKNRSKEQHYAFDYTFNQTCSQVKIIFIKLANCVQILY